MFWRRPPQALLVFKTKLLYCAGLPRPKQAALAESTVLYQISHAEKRDTLSAQFFLSNNFRNILRIKNIDAQDEVDSWENSIFSRKRRTKDCFLLTHNLKSKKVSVRDKFLPDAQFAPPLWNVAPALLSFTAISVAKSSQYYVLHNGHIWISQFLSSYPVILTFADTSYLI